MGLFKLRHINNVLSLVAAGLCFYLISAPFWPQAEFVLLKDDPPAVSQGSDFVPQENTLVIPKIKLQEAIYEGADASALKKGIWRRPRGSNPANGSNTILTGHRFTYTGSAVLYHLDKVREGDKITVYWDKEKYEYSVDKILEVPPTAGEVEAPSDQPMLTIYTCTPLITATNRLVIQAKLVGERA